MAAGSVGGAGELVGERGESKVPGGPSSRWGCDQGCWPHDLPLSMVTFITWLKEGLSGVST